MKSCDLSFATSKEQEIIPNTQKDWEDYLAAVQSFGKEKSSQKGSSFNSLESLASQTLFDVKDEPLFKDGASEVEENSTVERIESSQFPPEEVAEDGFSMLGHGKLSHEELKKKLGSHHKLVVVVGNGGTGKSTLQNGLAKKYIFDAGLSQGFGGITKDVLISPPIPELDGFRLVDTPGFNDKDKDLSNAGKIQIERLMGLGTEVLVIFVFRLNGNRLQESDFCLIKGFMGALPTKRVKNHCSAEDEESGVPFGVVFNRMSEAELEQWEDFEMEEQFKTILREELKLEPPKEILTLPVFPGIEVSTKRKEKLISEGKSDALIPKFDDDNFLDEDDVDKPNGMNELQKYITSFNDQLITLKRKDINTILPNISEEVKNNLNKKIAFLEAKTKIEKFSSSDPELKGLFACKTVEALDSYIEGRKAGFLESTNAISLQPEVYNALVEDLGNKFRKLWETFQSIELTKIEALKELFRTFERTIPTLKTSSLEICEIEKWFKEISQKPMFEKYWSEIKGHLENQINTLQRKYEEEYAANISAFNEHLKTDCLNFCGYSYDVDVVENSMLGLIQNKLKNENRLFLQKHFELRWKKIAANWKTKRNLILDAYVKQKQYLKSTGKWSAVAASSSALALFALQYYTGHPIFLTAWKFLRSAKGLSILKTTAPTAAVAPPFAKGLGRITSWRHIGQQISNAATEQAKEEFITAFYFAENLWIFWKDEDYLAKSINTFGISRLLRYWKIK